MSAPVEMLPDGEEAYRSRDGHTLAREDFRDAADTLFKGVWVLRGPDGRVLGHDRYRNDLEGRCGIRLRERE